MRVAFTIFGGAGWTGGINYLENLLSALADHPDKAIRPLLFAGTDADPALLARLTPYLAEPPILSPIWSRSWLIRLVRAICAFGLQRDFLAEREFRSANVDLAFQHGAWYGCWFPVPTLAWIADFQHRRLPQMFSSTRYLWRDAGYSALSRCATRILVSSHDAKRDCETYFPCAIGHIEVLPFAARIPSPHDETDLREIRHTYQLPEKFFFLPNQLWKHKNHLGIVAALQTIKSQGGDVVIVACGNPSDVRHSKYPQQVLNCVKDRGLDNHFIFLGMIPYQHVSLIMCLSAAVLNPSFFEGWSTTVEEAKSIGAPLILSDLPIHREQTGETAAFFNPFDPADIARVLTAQWDMVSPGPRRDAELRAAGLQAQRRGEFATNFRSIAIRTIDAGRVSRSHLVND